MPDDTYLVKFIIWDDPTATGAGNDKWNSNFQTVNTVDGLFEYTLGSNVNLPDNLFSDKTRWLEITVGTDPEISPRTRFVSAGYAYHTLQADSANIISDNAVSSSKIADGSILNADINSSAAIDVTKIAGTAVNLSSTQTITGEKRFGDSTMTVNNIGIRIGDDEAPTSLQLIRVERNYNTPANTYGYNSILDNQGTGLIFGVRSVVTNNLTTGSHRYALLGSSGTGLHTSGITFGVYSIARGGVGSSVYAVYGAALGAATTKYAGYFFGDVHTTGTLSKAAGAFKIDHPLDPANKYLVHSFVESPDMMNVYNGNVTTDGNGDAFVTLPDYFDALNKNFRYQLTVIGQFAQAIVSQKVSGNIFSIKTDLPNVEVSWQVTGVRKDAYAEAHRIKVEPEKPIAEKGLYLHPVELGLSETKQLHYEMNKARMLERERVESESTQ